MATYKAIHGVKVQYRDSDATAVEGDVWYNSTFGHLKMYAALGAWASGGNLNETRDSLAGAGIQTAAVFFGGNSEPAAFTTASEEYDGSSWTEGNNLNTGRYQPGGTGVQTAALACGGGTPSVTDETETYDGTSWTEVGDLNTSRRACSGHGSTTAALCAGGSPGPYYDVSEEYNGTSWTEGNNLNEARQGLFADCGTQTAGLIAGGQSGTPSPGTNAASSESYDGSSWTEGNNLNTGRSDSTGFGIQTAAMSVGGNTGSITGIAENYDGTSWTEVADLATARAGLGSASNAPNTLGIVGGGGNGSQTNATEEWTVAASIETVAFD